MARCTDLLWQGKHSEEGRGMQVKGETVFGRKSGTASMS